MWWCKTWILTWLLTLWGSLVLSLSTGNPRNTSSLTSRSINLKFCISACRSFWSAIPASCNEKLRLSSPNKNRSLKTTQISYKLLENRGYLYGCFYPRFSPIKSLKQIEKYRVNFAAITELHNLRLFAIKITCSLSPVKFRERHRNHKPIIRRGPQLKDGNFAKIVRFSSPEDKLPSVYSSGNVLCFSY